MQACRRCAFGVVGPLREHGSASEKLPILSLAEPSGKSGESPGLEDYIREYFPRPEEKLRCYAVSGERTSVLLKTGFEVYVRTLGATIEETRILLNKFTRDGRVPEPVRVARLAARACLHLKYP
jgi:endonuclease V-like protein UPF0215 family